MENQNTIDKDQERRNRYDKIIKTDLLRSSDSKLKQAKIILYLIGALNIAFGIYRGFFSVYFDIVAAIADIIVGGVYIWLAIRAEKKPYNSILIGLILYAGFVLLNGLVDIDSLLAGIVLKALIIAGLIKGLMIGKEVEELRKEISELE